MNNKTKTTAKTENGKLTLVPKLRFPEFRDSEGWEQSALGDLLEITSSKRVHESDWTDHGVPFYRAREIVALNNGEPITPLFISEELYRENAKRSGEIVPGDLLVSGVGSIGVPYLVKPNDRFYFKDGNIIWLKNRGTKLQGQFLLILYGTQFVQSQIKTMAGIGTVGTYTIDNANKTFVVFPTDDIEQQKIAECLSSVDELVAAQARKLDALKTHKKGLMQQLFPREGETQPRLRFPEFQTAGKWVAKPLGEIFPITSSKRVHESDWTATGVPFYRAREIVALNKQEPIQPLFISEELYSEFRKLTGEIREGHLLVTGVGSIGVPYLVKPGDRFYFKDGNIIWLKNDGDELIGDFLLRLYETDYVQKQLKKMADVGTVATYTIDNAKKTLAAFPTEKAEQQRIADCLTRLDDLIAAQTQTLEALEIHKQGLMQQLFPSPEEVES